MIFFWHHLRNYFLSLLIIGLIFGVQLYFLPSLHIQMLPFILLCSAYLFWNIRRTQKIEAQLKAHEERFEYVTETSGIGVWEYDLISGNVFTCLQHNRLYGQEGLLHGWGSKEFFSLIHPDDLPMVKRIIQKAMKTGELKVDYRVLWPDRSLHWLSARGRTEFDRQGRPQRMVGTLMDITAKKKTEQLLQEALFYRDEFLSIASHEFKTPLTSLKLQSQMFLRSAIRNEPETYSPERVDRLVGETVRQVGRLDRLVDDMLDISRIRTGKLSFSKERTNIAEFVVDVVERIRPQFADSGREVPRLALLDEGEILCDKMRIEQVLKNLLNNAYLYGKGLPVDVLVKCSGARVEIAVKDRGIGITREDQKRIFSRFQRAVPAREVSGLGLGLYIAKQIVEAHDGRITVESIPNEGSTFRLDLPLLENPAERPYEEQLKVLYDGH